MTKRLIRQKVPRQRRVLMDIGMVAKKASRLLTYFVALRGFEPKVVFAGHLSIMIDFEDLIENGMPSKKEREVIDEFESRLDSLLKGHDSEKPNALFLARITWNKTRELIWRIYNAEIANEIHQKVIDQNQCPRQFDYRIDHDNEWKLAEWSLKNYS